jgi:hypothetical protein
MPFTVPLSKPLKTHDGEVTQLTLRDLTASDIVMARVPPVKLIANSKEDEEHAEFRYDIIMQLASRLTGIDDLILGGLSARDFHAVANAVVKLWNASGE